MKLLSLTAFAIAITLPLLSCENDKKNNLQTIKTNDKSTIKYAKGFDIQHFNNYTKLIIKAPYQNSTETFEFVLTSNKSNSDLNTIQIPVNSIVVTSTTHIPFLELLQAENKLVGFPNTNFISSEKTRKLINQNLVKELGHPENLNTETLLELNPDVVVGFSIGSNNKIFNTIEKLGIPVVFNGDWLEETPLGRAEWIKFFGALFDKQKKADSIFNVIEKNYLGAKQIAKKSKNKPSIVSGGLYKDVWYLPAGESFEAAFLTDANTNYLWSNSKGKGSLALNVENVFLKGKDAQIWISPSFHYSLHNIKDTNAIYSKFKAFQTGSIYSYFNRKGETGGILYFELSPTRPDLVLKDIIKIAHPELLPEYQFTFYEKLK
ncbi:MAG: ABC transporter substrate-binding protein [Lutibacter sp.]|nr:ABC transporter substrate-binding protein [Lutibacter sp.]